MAYYVHDNLLEKVCLDSIIAEVSLLLYLHIFILIGIVRLTMFCCTLLVWLIIDIRIRSCLVLF